MRRQGDFAVAFQFVTFIWEGWADGEGRECFASLWALTALLRRLRFPDSQEDLLRSAPMLGGSLGMFVWDRK